MKNIGNKTLIFYYFQVFFQWRSSKRTKTTMWPQ